MGLNLDSFQYDLPSELIAQFPAQRRDRSRLMVLDRASGKVSHHLFCDLPGLLGSGDLLVANDTRVLPARFFCRRKSGGRIEALFVVGKSPGEWEVMLRGANKCRTGEVLDIEGGGDTRLRLVENLGQGSWMVGILPEGAKATAAELLAKFGRTPLPPYIRRPAYLAGPDSHDILRYQTVFAARDGAVAAPTAGLHFTDELLAQVGRAGVERTFVTLHVGPGTFAPVKSADISRHKMHAEWFELSEASAGRINSAKAAGRRILAVGTTSVRVLETAARQSLHDICDPCSGWTDIFIYPPAEFRAVDALITNFHLPGSTLLMLVAAFCSPGSTDGIAMTLDAYRHAIAEKYRFYSYGDAMLIA